MSSTGDDAAQPKPATAFEQHAMTILGIIIAALLVWVGNTVTTTQTELGKVGTTVEIMSTRIGTLEETLNEFRRDYVRRADYDRDQAHIDARFENVTTGGDRRQ